MIVQVLGSASVPLLMVIERLFDRCNENYAPLSGEVGHVPVNVTAALDFLRDVLALAGSCRVVRFAVIEVLGNLKRKVGFIVGPVLVLRACCIDDDDDDGGSGPDSVVPVLDTAVRTLWRFSLTNEATAKGLLRAIENRDPRLTVAAPAAAYRLFGLDGLTATRVRPLVRSKYTEGLVLLIQQAADRHSATQILGKVKALTHTTQIYAETPPVSIEGTSEQHVAAMRLLDAIEAKLGPDMAYDLALPSVPAMLLSGIGEVDAREIDARFKRSLKVFRVWKRMLDVKGFAAALVAHLFDPGAIELSQGLQRLWMFPGKALPWLAFFAAMAPSPPEREPPLFMLVKAWRTMPVPSDMPKALKDAGLFEKYRKAYKDFKSRYGCWRTEFDQSPVPEHRLQELLVRKWNATPE